MERSLCSWTVAGGQLFDEDGPGARDRVHRAALREARQEGHAASPPERPRTALQGWIARVMRQRSAHSTTLACCAAA